eukprot:SAG25_NODE_2857_length_1347_cov_1.638622_1_plen_348_part_00
MCAYVCVWRLVSAHSRARRGRVLGPADEHGHGALHYACEAGLSSMINGFIMNGARIVGAQAELQPEPEPEQDAAPTKDSGVANAVDLEAMAAGGASGGEWLEAARQAAELVAAQLAATLIVEAGAGDGAEGLSGAAAFDEGLWPERGPMVPPMLRGVGGGAGYRRPRAVAVVPFFEREVVAAAAGGGEGGTDDEEVYEEVQKAKFTYGRASDSEAEEEDGEPDAFTKEWAELTEEERGAAAVLVRAGAAERGEIMASQKYGIVEKSQPVLYYDQSHDLHPHPHSRKTSRVGQGCSEEDWAEAAEKEWEEWEQLSAEQRGNAMVLGLDEEAWPPGSCAGRFRLRCGRF